MSLVRSAGLQGFRQTVEELGGDAERFARQSGLPLEALDHDEILVEDTAIATVLEIAAANLQCPDLGLRVAEVQDISMLGPLSVAIQNSPSVQDALECTTRYMFVHAQNHSMTVTPDPEGGRGIVAVRYSIGPGKQQLPQSADMTLLFGHRATTFLLGGPYGLWSVALPHPPLAPVARYEQAFGAPVRFNAPEALSRIPAGLLKQPLGSVDATLRQLALAYLSRQQPQPGAVVSSKVRGVLRQSLGTGSTDIVDIARTLAVHPRTLQRQLADEGETFTNVLDAVRRSAAEEYLTSTELPFTQISNLLGFAEPAVLSRCARRWWGKTPSEMRQHTANPAGQPS